MREGNQQQDLLTDVSLDHNGVLRGFVVDCGDLATRFAVDVLIDGLPIALLRAHDYVADLECGDSCYGFSIKLSRDLMASAKCVEVRLSNSDRRIGEFVNDGAGLPIGEGPKRLNFVQWAGGLRLSGWLDGEHSSPPVVKALLQGQELSRATCTSWTHVAEGGSYKIARAFDLHLPRHLANGRVHTIDVMTEEGLELVGSPCLVFALDDGFAGIIDSFANIESERVRARFADGLLPQWVPFSELEAWQARFPVALPVTRPVVRMAVVVVGETDLEATLSSLDEQDEVNWIGAVLPSTASPVGFNTHQLQTFLAQDGRACDLVIATVSGTRFAPYALSIFADVALRFTGALAFYSDVAVKKDGHVWPLGFPSYDEELFLEQGYCGLLFALRPAVIEAALSRGCDSLYGLFPIASHGDLSSVSGPVHLPTILATLPELPVSSLREALQQATSLRLAADSISADVIPLAQACTAAVRVRRRVPSFDVSVVIPVRNGGDAIGRTMQSVRATCGGVRIQFLIADNDSVDPKTISILDSAERQGIQVLRLGGWFSEPQLINRAAKLSRCDHMLVLRPGIVAREPDWLEEMLSRVVDRDVGAVGGLIAWPNGIVREAGLVLGPRLSVSPRFRDRHIDDQGYAGWLEVAHQVSAVSAACMMTRRHWFDIVAGFDERYLSTTYYDVDYCLRLREKGCRVVFTPHARLTQTSDDQVNPVDTLLKPVVEREIATLRARWGLAPGCDPFYSPWMAMDGAPYAGLGWPPVPFQPRQPHHPRARQSPLGL